MYGFIRTMLLTAFGSLFLSGCLYINTTSPLDINLNQTELGDKVGEASQYMVLWMVAWGDAGTKAAAENGGITQVNHADRQTKFYFFGVYARSTTVVYGD
ncbi:MAG: hypothetical protein DRH08_14655 [Deltaproteobacteria bacterium]|nr:MAG: hypothetical protein DRH08_14655 [Deltaproteobacteria bacterium]